MVDLKEAPARQIAEQPPKRWRNRWRKVDHEDRPNFGVYYSIGDEFWGRRLWPSKDTAESAAARNIENNARRFGDNSCEYLGAFEVDE